MKRECLVKKGLAILFVIVLLIAFLKSGSYRQLDLIAGYLQQNESAQMEPIEANFTSNVWRQQSLINLNGAMARKLNMRGYYSDLKMYITENDYIVSASPYTSTDYEYEQTVAFRDFLSAHGINLLYVNEPTKYIDDDIFLQYGVETYSNRNADQFLRRLEFANINTIDLREDIIADNLAIEDLFYRTDHHWTTRTGLWATQIIAQGLNEKCGYNIDTSIYDIGNYSIRGWKNCWLGEQGRKVAKTYVGLDDFEEITPNFSTSFTFKDGWEGTFDDFVDESVYGIENNKDANPSWHYSYYMLDCVNHNAPGGKVLLIADSYSHVMQPFLALGVREIDTIVIRDQNSDFNLENYILENGYDTVVIAYAQFMIGAHDDPDSANYRMFSFMETGKE